MAGKGDKIMKEKLKREEIQELIEKAKTSDDFKKIKKLAMHSSFKLGSLRRKFCKKCYAKFPENSIIRIKNNKKIIKCKECGSISRLKLK